MGHEDPKVVGEFNLVPTEAEKAVRERVIQALQGCNQLLSLFPDATWDDWENFFTYVDNYDVDATVALSSVREIRDAGLRNNAGQARKAIVEIQKGYGVTLERNLFIRSLFKQLFDEYQRKKETK